MHEARRLVALAVGDRGRHVGRDQREQRERELEHVARHAIGEAQLLDHRLGAEIREQVVPAAVRDWPGGLRDVAEDGERSRRAAREHAELHRRQVLRLVDDHVAVRPVAALEQRPRLVEERQVGVARAPAAAGLQKSLLRGVQDAGRCRGELPGARQQPAEELVGLRARPQLVERAIHEAAAAERRLQVFEREVSGVPEARGVALIERARQLRAQSLAPGRVARGLGSRLLQQTGDLLRREPELDPFESDGEQLGRRLRQRRDRRRDHVGHPGVAFQPGERRLLAPRGRDARELVHGALLHAFLAEHRQDVRDVVHEDRIRPDDQDTAALELPAVGVEQPRRAVQADRGLPGAWPALDDECALGLARDQAVLVGLDRRDDVAHVPVAAAFELLEQDVRDAVDDVAGGAVERLVVEVEQRAALGAETGGGASAPCGSATVAV